MTDMAKIIRYGCDQTVLLPRGFHIPGSEVHVRRIGRSLLLIPSDQAFSDTRAVFAEIDRIGSADFLQEDASNIKE